ncbi:hypothetical protein HUU39_27660 [candidate division KSB1 bacterium]|nr:hypothetical protein [candidate division KSB1 bacterium]
MPSHHFLRARSRGAIGCSRRFNHNATRMCALSVALLFLAFGEMPLPAQDKPMKWGEVPRADLEMKSFPADSNASAVILCDFGEVSFDTEYELNFWRHRRIKILSPAGFKWGEVFLTYRAKDRSQRINDLEGFTFILAADGTVRREKLDKKSIFEEKVDDEHRRNIAIACIQNTPSICPIGLFKTASRPVGASCASKFPVCSTTFWCTRRSLSSMCMNPASGPLPPVAALASKRCTIAG